MVFTLLILQKEIEALYKFRDLFFENHPLEMATQRNIIVEDRKKLLVEKCETIDGKLLRQIHIFHLCWYKIILKYIFCS